MNIPSSNHDAIELGKAIEEAGFPRSILTTSGADITINEALLPEECFHEHVEPATRDPREGETGRQPIMELEYDAVADESFPTDRQAVWRERRVKPEIVKQITAIVEAHIAAAPERAQRATIARYEARVQAYLDDTARAWGYDDMGSASSYADEAAVARYQAEGKLLRAWRSQVWAACYEALQKIMGGALELPPEEKLVAMLPAPPDRPA